MLGLKLATDPRWVNIAEKSIHEILMDHAYCEQKAASTGISLIVMYPDRKRLVEEITPLVAEEWTHFRMVLKKLEERGLSLGERRNDEYVHELQKIIHKGGSKETQMMERLLIAGLIEARSCERFRLLSLHIQDDDLKQFYHELMVSEAGHYRLFLDLACEYNPKEKVKKRFDQMLEQEAEIMKNLALRGDRIH
jgi:tRNA-(ms[2]io[6]A)-hydroxylase